MKGLKHISHLLLLSILILIGHSLVPHHHHVASAIHPSSHECPAGDHEHHDEEGQICHAFNNIAFVIYNQSGIPAPAGFSWDVIYLEPGQVQGPQIVAFAIRHLLLKPPTVSKEFSGNHSLRGPPVLS